MRRSRLPLLVVALSLLATIVTTLFVAAVSVGRDAARFAGAASLSQDRIRSRLDTCVAMLLGARGLFSALGDKGEVTAADFREYVARLDLDHRYAGVQGIGWSRREGARQPVRYLEPLDRRNLAALGFDMASESVRREAMERARDTGEPAASGRVTLVQEIDPAKQAGFLIYLPVYRGGRTPATVAARRGDLLGFVYAAFRANDLLDALFAHEPSPRVALELRDGADPIYRSPLAARSTRHALVRRFDLAGHPFTLRFTPLPESDVTPTTALVGSLFAIGLLLSGAFYWIARSRVAAQQSLLAELAERERAAAAIRASEERTKAAWEQAQRADRRKDEFLAMLGHELRNPLAPILTALELMKLRGESDAHAHEREVIERQVQHLVRLVDDLLDVSRITRGKVRLKREPVELAPVVCKAIEMASPLLEQRSHNLAVDVPRSGLWLLGDATRMAQVLANLLTNAAKYTPPGGHIEVSARRDGDALELTVRDDGVGIPPEMVSRVFDLFVQGERTLDRAEGGLGLGLALVRNLVELHGGNVIAKSDGPGRGSEFLVRLPAAEPPAASAAPRALAAPALAAPSRAGRKRVLVVDDNEDAVELLALALEQVGHAVAVAHDGPEALALAPDFRPDVALLDIGLPVMDGYQLARHLRALSPSLRLIAITGYGQEHDRARSVEAGFEAHFVKPVDIAHLLQAIAAPADAAAASLH